MSDLIDRGKVNRVLKNIADHLKERNSLKESLMAGVIEGVAIDTINSQPAVDAEPVVRCRDCKHYDDPYICTYWADDIQMEADDFCFPGRKEGNRWIRNL